MKTIATKVVTNEDFQNAQTAVATLAQLIDALYKHGRLPMESRIKVDLAANQQADFELRVERLTSAAEASPNQDNESVCAAYDTLMKEMNTEIDQLEQLCSASGVSRSALWPTSVRLGFAPR